MHSGRWKHYERGVESEMIDLEKLEEYIEEYLLTRPDDDGEEWYATYRHFATCELTAFVEWLEEKNLEEEDKWLQSLT